VPGVGEIKHTWSGLSRSLQCVEGGKHEPITKIHAGLELSSVLCRAVPGGEGMGWRFDLVREQGAMLRSED
jgi:hypothetical protein